jgi:hypothetical protein
LLGFDAVTIQQKSDLYSSSGGTSAFYTKVEVDAFEFNWFIGGDLTCEKTGIGLVSENCFYKGDL